MNRKEREERKKSTHKGVKQRPKDVTQTQRQQSPDRRRKHDCQPQYSFDAKAGTLGWGCQKT